MGCCASVVKVAPADGADYEEQDVYINPSEYDEDAASCKVQFGEITYSKADSDGIITTEAGGMMGMRKRLIIAQAFILHGINGDPNQYTPEALKESPKLNRKETTRVLQWVDDTLQCALYQHIANNPKKSHVTLRGIASSAKFKNRTLVLTEPAESCGITESSQASAPEIALNAAVSSPHPRPQHLTIPAVEETKSASSVASKIRPRAPRRGSVSSDSNFSARVGKGGLIDSPQLSADERLRQRAFDVRHSFAPNLSTIINLDAALLALNQHCQAIQIARDTGSQHLMGSTLGGTGTTSRSDEAARTGLPSFRSVSEFSATKLVDVREVCLRYNLPADDYVCKSGVTLQSITVDCTVGQLHLRDFADDVTKQLNLLADRSESVASPTVSDRRDSVKTNDRGEHGERSGGAFPSPDARGRTRRFGPSSHVLEVPVPNLPSPQPMVDISPLGHRFGSPADSALSWKERTLTFDALKTFVKYQTFLLKQRKSEEIEFDRRVHTRPPSLRTLVFGPYPYSAHQIRPGLVPPSGPITGASRAALQRNMGVPARRSLQPPPQSSDSERDD